MTGGSPQTGSVTRKMLPSDGIINVHVISVMSDMPWDIIVTAKAVKFLTQGQYLKNIIEICVFSGMES